MTLRVIGDILCVTFDAVVLAHGWTLCVVKCVPWFEEMEPGGPDGCSVLCFSTLVVF